MDSLEFGVRRGGDVVMEKHGWLWEGWIPLGGITIIDGDPGTGKSLLTTKMAAGVSSGLIDLPGGVQDGPGAPVVMMTAEDGIDDTVAPRLVAHGADMDNLWFVTEHESTGKAPMLPDHVGQIEHVVRSKKAKLLIIDPIAEFVAPEYDLNRDQDARFILRPLTAIARKLNISVIIVRHMNKQSGERNTTYRGSGSIGIIGAARSGISIAKPKKLGDPGILSVFKSNRSHPVQPVAFRIVSGDPAESLQWDRDWVQQPKSSTRPINLAMESLKECLSKNGPIRAQDAIRQLAAKGFNESTVRRAFGMLGGHIVKLDNVKANFWSLNHAPAPQPTHPQESQNGSLGLPAIPTPG